MGPICTALGIAGVHGVELETRCQQNKPMATLKMRNVIFSSGSNLGCPRSWGKPSKPSENQAHKWLRPCWLGRNCWAGLSAVGRGSGAKASSAVTATCEPFFTHAVWIVRQFPVTEPFPKRANCSLGPKLTPIGPILSPGAAVRHFQNASRCRSGLPGAGKKAQSSGLQRICCIL